MTDNTMIKGKRETNTSNIIQITTQNTNDNKSNHKKVKADAHER